MTKNLSILQKFIRLYTFYTPINKGKYRLALASLKFEGDLPSQVLAKTKDGRILKVNFDNHFAHFVYFLGEYEKAVTEIVKKIVEKGDICLDIGANFGWYTTLFQKLVGENGQVHSFEPVSDTFKILSKNVNMNNNSEIVRINNLALGDSEQNIKLFIPPDKSDGHASISDFGNPRSKVSKGKMITLDSYLEKNTIGEVKFVKADIEGAELSMLEGATKLFQQKKPPIFEMEMALETNREFGYKPNDLIQFISEKADYEFYKINERSHKIEKIKGFKKDDPGANVLCVPKGFYTKEIKRLKVDLN